MGTVKQKLFCYREPDFPKQAYAVVLFIYTPKGDLAILPFSFIYSNLNTISDSVEESIHDLSSGGKYSFDISDMVGIFPISFQTKIPLKKEYWTESKNNSLFEERLKAFIKVIDKPFLYKLLVTPYAFNREENHWILNCTYPFSIFSEDKEIEDFMYSSNQIVDPSANSAAVYMIENPKRYNWKSGELSDIELNAPKQKPIES